MNKVIIAAFLQNATIESLCASVCVCVSMCFCTITQKEIDLGTWNIKYIVVFENNSVKFDTGHCRTKVKVTMGLYKYCHT